MNRLTATTVVSLAILTLAVTCARNGVFEGSGKAGEPGPRLPADQSILFEVEYVNFAWGFQCQGWYVDGEGRRYAYHYDLEDDPFEPNDWENITPQELQEKYSHHRRLIDVIGVDLLIGMKELIPAASQGTLSERVQMCADYGGKGYLAYVQNATTGTYRPVLLYEAGDWAQKNLSPEAEMLFQWMRAVEGAVGQPECGYPERP